VRAIAGACASPPRHRPVLVNSSAEWEKLEVQTRHHRLNIGMRAGYGFWYTKTIGYNLISIPDIDPSEVVFNSSADIWGEAILETAAHGPTAGPAI
jgi:hypothetical protein